jgi:hypothetical protein
MEAFVKEVLEEFVEIFKEAALYYAKVYKNKQGKDTLSDSDIVRDMKAQVTDDGLSIEVYNYYIYIRDGRKPNSRMPNFSAILNWIKRKRIKGRNKKGQFISDNSLAWAICKGIAKNGILARPFLNDAYYEASGIFNERFNEEMNKVVDNLLIAFVKKEK